MSEYQYAVLFEVNNLSDRELKKIESYFKIKRQSGGGECGEVEKVRDNTYKISFLDKAAQDRVLSKTDHIVLLPGRGNVPILIKQEGITEEKTLPPQSTSDLQVPENKPMQKVIKLDSYLLHFLKVNSRAKSDLEEELSSLLSTFKIDMVTETVVVVRDPIKQDETVVQQKWESKIDTVFSSLQIRYVTHFEVEPKRLEILQKNPALFPQNLGINEENDLFVIVGERKEVEKFLKVIDALQLCQRVRKECPVPETRYAVVKEKFEQKRQSKFSKVEITQEKSGCLVLNGPDEQINSAETTLQELLGQIQETTLPLPHPLKVFLSASGATQIFQTRFQQNLCSPVFLDATGSGSNLVLLSLSAGALQEAATAIRRDLCEETVLLEQAESESSGLDTLKNDLSNALQQANCGTSKVELKYEPGAGSDPRMKLHLVGYSTEVNKCKNIIQDYKKNYADFSDSVTLPFAEMVDIFFELLPLLGVTASNVNLTPISSPVPRVNISGPRCKVADIKSKLLSSFNSLVRKNVPVDGPGAVQFFQDKSVNTRELLQSSYKVLISFKIQTGAALVRNQAFSSLPNIPASLVPPSYPVSLEIVFGSLEEQKADVLVAPMLNTNLTSTKVGKSLLTKAGRQLKSNFDAAKRRCIIAPGDVLEVDGTPLGCKKIFFIECLPWTGNTHNSEKAIRCGLQRALELYDQQAWSSVALPVIGPGIALAVPIQNAADILTGEIGTFGRTSSTGSLKTIRIVLMPNYADSEQIYEVVHSGLSALMVDHTGQAVFQSLNCEIDEIIIPLARCQIHLIYGDISNEITDVVVNTTNFTDLWTDVCNDILTVAGAEVRAALKGVQVKKEEICITPPGAFPCKAIMHVCGEKDTNIIQKLVQEILHKCELNGYKSVAIPAICAGKGGLDAHVVAQAILQGVKDATVQANLNKVKTIHIVLKKIHVFLAFKTMAQQIFGRFPQTSTPSQVTPLRAAPASLRPDLGLLFQCIADKHPTAEFVVMGLSDSSVSKACHELCHAYKSHCSTDYVSHDELEHLTQAELGDLIDTVTPLGIQITQRPNGLLEVSGLTKGVNEFTQRIRGALVRQVRQTKQDNVFSKVSWCILGSRGIWERLPKEAHSHLEEMTVGGVILDAQSQKWTVNLTRMEATADVSKTVTQIKRLENLPDFIFPRYWDVMNQGDVLNVVPLHCNSAEYKRVKSDFKRTVAKTVIKIERIQNVNLRRAYEVRKKELQKKNGTNGAGEKALYHGTTNEASTSIMRTNFNRSFAGQNATVYGIGTYFAVDASYSANPKYSVPSTDGTQLMFVSLVLTGHFALGTSDMRVPPSRSQDPNDRFDSLVDNMQKPNMFVVFHDCQACPDYLITFK